MVFFLSFLFFTSNLLWVLVFWKQRQDIAALVAYKEASRGYHLS